MNAEDISDLRRKAQKAWDERSPYAGWADAVLDCLDEIERLRGWLWHLDVHCNRTGWYGTESVVFRALKGDEVPE